MDLKTVILLLAVGSFLFGLLLLVFKFNKKDPQEVPFWIVAKLLQAAGSMMLYYRTDTFDILTIIANIALLSGCAYEAWAIRVLTGHPVKRRLHVTTAVGIILVCSFTVFLDMPYRTGVVFLLQSLFYFLPGYYLFVKSGKRFSLQLILAVCYCVTGSIFLTGAVSCLFFPKTAVNMAEKPISGMIPGASFCLFLVSGFIMLMLAKERSDIKVQEIQKTLKKSESRFQQIVETAIEGILIFDNRYRITFATKTWLQCLDTPLKK